MWYSDCRQNGCIIGANPAFSDEYQMPDVFSGRYITRSHEYIGKSWKAERLILGGKRSDGYLFVGYMLEPGDVMRMGAGIGTAALGELVIGAGCRFYTVAQAREHWRKPDIYETHREANELIDKIEAKAREMFPEQFKPTPPVEHANPGERIVTRKGLAKMLGYLGACTPATYAEESFERAGFPSVDSVPVELFWPKIPESHRGWVISAAHSIAGKSVPLTLRGAVQVTDEVPPVVWEAYRSMQV